MPSVDLLQWFILGCFVRVFQWPMGFLQIALGKSLVWFSTQTLFSIIHIVTIWIGLQVVGLEGVSMAFTFSYFVFVGVIVFIARELTGFCWSIEVQKLVVIFSIVILLDFLLIKFSTIGVVTPIIIMVICSIYCLRKLVSRLDESHPLARIYLRMPRVKFLMSERKGRDIEK